MRMGNIIEPSVFSTYVRERIVENSPIIKSGAVTNSDTLAKLASGGGRTVSMPYWNRISGDSEVLSTGAALSATTVTAKTDVAAINYRGKAWSANELASALAGDSAVTAIAEMVADYWIREEQKMLVSTLAGVFGSPDMSGHVFGDSGSPNKLSAEVVLDAKQLLGDAFSQLHSIIMHSKVYTSLQKQDLITFMRPSTGAQIAEYLGYNVIVDDSVQFDESNGVYSTYLLAEGVIGRGDGSPVDFTQVETSRDGLKGDDYLIYRKALILHPFGIAYQGKQVAGISPTNEELRDAQNWKCVYETKSIGMIEIRHIV